MKAKKQSLSLFFSLSDQEQTCRPWGVRNLYGDFDFFTLPAISSCSSSPEQGQGVKSCSLKSEPACLMCQTGFSVAAGNGEGSPG